MSNTEKLITILKDSEVIVGYEPLADEVQYERFFLEYHIPRPQFIILANAAIVPEAIAKNYTKKCGRKTVSILIPGRQFDIVGTRHGRGGGWYDRFLAATPKEWRRIGVAKRVQIADAPLVREGWDQPIDYLLVDTDTGWNAYVFESR